MHPAELLRLPASSPQHSQHLAVERQFIDASGESSGTVEVLLGAGGDADGPRRSGVLISGRVGPGLAAEPGLGIRGRRHIDLHLAKEGPFVIEHLDASVSAVGNVDISLSIGGNVVWRVKLTRSFARFTPLLHPVAV